MPVHFKGITEYRNKYRAPQTRSRSASNHRRMLAGLRSAHQGISREPQILSRRKIPTHQPQVSRSMQWDQLSEPSRAEPIPPVSTAAGDPGAKEAAAVAEIPETPVAPRGPRPPEARVSLEQSQPQPQPQPHSPSQSPTDQRPEPPLNGVEHVLRRKAGLRPDRPAMGGPHSSEYQRQFEWKDRVANSPLLAAEQALHSSTVLPMHGFNPVPFESEYSRNFKGSPPPRPPRLRRDVEKNEVPLFQRENVPPEKASKAKRKKRKEQHSDRKRNNSKEEAAEYQSSIPQQGAALPKAQQTVVPTPGYRKVKSEYNKSFRSPLEYQYKDGAWVKALNTAEEGAGSAHSVAWYNEVRELREKAAMYRRRAWGTHFSRNHFVQLLSDLNHMWEASTTTGSSSEQSGGTTSSPTIEALDLARVGSGAGSASSAPSAGNTSTRGHPGTPMGPLAAKQAWGAKEERKRKEAEPAGRTDVPAEGRQGEEETEEKEGEEEEDGQEERENGGNGSDAGDRARESVGSSRSREAGRLPTPKLKTFPLAQRTHNDRTTPTTGGAILVSPPKVRASMRGRPSPSPQGKPRSPQRLQGRVSPAPPLGKAEEARLVPTPPAAGLTTVDPLPLREDAGCGPSVAKERSKRSPAPRPSHKRGSNAQAWAAPCAMLPANRIQGALRNPEFQHNGNLGLHRPGLFVYPSGDSTLSDDDDRMSQISARSAASCSMAAKVLGRALKRKENFWGKS